MSHEHSARTARATRIRPALRALAAACMAAASLASGPALAQEQIDFGGTVELGVHDDVVFPPTLTSDSGVIEVVPPTSIPIGADGTNPGIAPGAPGGDPLG